MDPTHAHPVVPHGTPPGDAVWVPTWTWHRVDYIDGVTALSASLFHPRHEQASRHHSMLSPRDDGSACVRVCGVSALLLSALLSHERTLLRLT